MLKNLKQKSLKHNITIVVLVILILILGLYLKPYVIGGKGKTTDGWYYHLLNGQALITGYGGEEIHLVFPAKIYGKPVVEINDNFFSSQYLETVVIPEGVIYIGERAFVRQKNLRNIHLPNTIEKIGPFAFYDCASLMEIKIPPKVNIIRQFTFGNCINLKTVMIPEGLQEIETQSFRSCSSLEKINFPESLQILGSEAFAYCKSLKEISFPTSMDSLGKKLFKECRNLENIKAPVYVKEVKEYAFEDTIWLENKRKEKEFIIFGGNLIEYAGNQKHVRIPSEVKLIAEGAFNNNKMLKEVTIPSSVEHVYTFAFEFCNNLDTVIIEDGVGGFDYMSFYDTNLKTLIFQGSLPKDKGENLLDDEILPNITVYAPAGSDVEVFAMENNVKFHYLDEYGMN